MYYFLLIPIVIGIVLLFLKQRKLEKKLKNQPVNDSVNDQLKQNRIDNQTLWGRLYGK